MLILSELAGQEPGFLVSLLITSLGKQSPLNILFCHHLLHSLPMLFPLPLYPCLIAPLRVPGKSIIVKLTGEKFKIWYIFKIQRFTICYSGCQLQISSTEIYLSFLLITCASMLFCNYFIYQRLILSYILIENSKSLWYIVSTIIDFS